MIAVYLIASLRTNVVFVGLFFFLDITFWLLVTACMCTPLIEGILLTRASIDLNIGYGNVTNILMILKAAGAFGFLTTVCGWYRTSSYPIVSSISR